MATSQPGDRPQRPRTPRWVKVFVVIALVLLVIFAIAQVLGIQHGPGLHSALGAGPAAGVENLPV